MTFLRKTAALKAAAALAGIGALHIAWGRGMTYPFKTQEELGKAVFPGDEFPSASACNAVGGALFAASALTAGVGGRTWWARTGRNVVVGVLTARGIAGVTGATRRTLPESADVETFVELDKKIYGPLCLTLAGLVWFGTRKPKRKAKRA